MKPTNPNADKQQHLSHVLDTHCWTSLLDTPTWHYFATLSWEILDILIWHFCGTLLGNTGHSDLTRLPDTFVGHSCLTLFWDTLTWPFIGHSYLTSLDILVRNHSHRHLLYNINAIIITAPQIHRTHFQKTTPEISRSVWTKSLTMDT